MNFVVELVFHPYAIAFFERVMLCFPVVGCSILLTLCVGVLVGFSMDLEDRL